MAGNKPGRGSDQFPLRLPDGMRDMISEAADRNGRSMNAEIVARIEAYETGGKDAFEWRRRFEDEHALRNRLEELYAKMAENAEGLRDLAGLFKSQLSLHLGMVQILSGLIQKLDGKPTPDVLATARQAEEHAASTLAGMGTTDPTFDIIRKLAEQSATLDSTEM